MGIVLAALQKLQSLGLVEAGASVLDIGSSNLYSASVEGLRGFIQHYDASTDDAAIDEFVARLAKGSSYDPIKGGLNESFAGELLEYCDVKYLAFDIADGYRTEIVDLNSAQLPKAYKGAFDLVMNFGTTEHILNQYNCFRVIHDATRVGGRIVHSLPISGYTDHGYFVYTGRMFFDMAGRNNYEIEEAWIEGPSGEDDLLASMRSYLTYFPKLEQLAHAQPIGIRNCTMTIILRKTRGAPFVAGLETSTSVGNIPANVRGMYNAGASLLATTQVRGRVQRLLSGAVERIRRR